MKTSSEELSYPFPNSLSIVLTAFMLCVSSANTTSKCPSLSLSHYLSLSPNSQDGVYINLHFFIFVCADIIVNAENNG